MTHPVSLPSLTATPEIDWQCHCHEYIKCGWTNWPNCSPSTITWSSQLYEFDNVTLRFWLVCFFDCPLPILYHSTQLAASMCVYMFCSNWTTTTRSRLLATPHSCLEEFVILSWAKKRGRDSLHCELSRVRSGWCSTDSIEGEHLCWQWASSNCLFSLMPATSYLSVVECPWALWLQVSLALYFICSSSSPLTSLSSFEVVSKSFSLAYSFACHPNIVFLSTDLYLYFFLSWFLYFSLYSKSRSRLCPFSRYALCWCCSG